MSITARQLNRATLARQLLLEKYDGPGENLTEWARASLPIAIAWQAA